MSAGSDLGTANLASGPAAGAVAVFVVAASWTVLGPLLAVTLAGAERSAQSLKSLETWLLSNLNTITVILLLVPAASTS